MLQGTAVTTMGIILELLSFQYSQTCCFYTTLLLFLLFSDFGCAHAARPSVDRGRNLYISKQQ